MISWMVCCFVAPSYVFFHRRNSMATPGPEKKRLPLAFGGGGAGIGWLPNGTWPPARPAGESAIF